MSKHFANFTNVVGESEDCNDPGLLASKEQLSLEDFSSIALPAEFEKRATAAVVASVKPLETQLFEQFPSMIQESQDTITTRYQQLQDDSFLDMDLTHVNPTPFSSLADGTDFFSTTADIEAFSNMDALNMISNEFQAPYHSNSDPSFARWDPQAATYQAADRSTSSEVGFPTNLSGTCIDFCTYQIPQNNQLRTPSPSTHMTAGLSSPDKDSKIMDMLQSMNKSILALERKLEHRGSPN